MTNRLRALLALPLLFAAAFAMAAADAESGIRKILDDQAAAWNRADLPAFVEFYAPDCVYIGKTVAHGRTEVLTNYRRHYSTREAMGTLRFSDIKVSRTDTHSAIAVGHFHLDRSAAAGGPADGTFSLVLVERNGKWLILLDHTS